MQNHPFTPGVCSDKPSLVSESSGIRRRARPNRALPWALLLSPALAGADPANLARDKNCFSCHKLEGKRIGPAYVDVARKYARDKEAKLKLVRQIEDGSTNQTGPIGTLPQPIVAIVSGFPTAEEWRTVTMPAQPQVSVDEAALLADWILSLGR